MSKDKGSKDVPGNAIASQAAFDREMVRTAAGIYRVDDVLARLYEDDCNITRFGIICPNMLRTEYMGVVNAVSAGAPIVAFHGGQTFKDCLVGMLARIENGSITWRADKPR